MTLDTSHNRWQRIYFWILRKGPRFLAHAIAGQAFVLNHDEGNAWCWPCAARARMVADNHRCTLGPMATQYCIKCGLDKADWPKWCSNRVEKVNNRPPRAPRHVSVGW